MVLRSEIGAFVALFRTLFRALFWLPECSKLILVVTVLTKIQRNSGFDSSSARQGACLPLAAKLLFSKAAQTFTQHNTNTKHTISSRTSGACCKSTGRRPRCCLRARKLICGSCLHADLKLYLPLPFRPNASCAPLTQSQQPEVRRPDRPSESGATRPTAARASARARRSEEASCQAVAETGAARAQWL